MQLSSSFDSKRDFGGAVTSIGRTESLTKRDSLKSGVPCIKGKQLGWDKSAQRQVGILYRPQVHTHCSFIFLSVLDSGYTQRKPKVKDVCEYNVRYLRAASQRWIRRVQSASV